VSKSSYAGERVPPLLDPRMDRMPIDLDTLFPMRDRTSACLMKLKAQCLRTAGIIDRMQKVAIDTRADGLLMGSPPDPRAVAQSARCANRVANGFRGCPGGC
jgi:hypothetical protein